MADLSSSISSMDIYPPHYTDSTGTSFKNPWPSAESTLYDLIQPFIAQTVTDQLDQEDQHLTAGTSRQVSPSASVDDVSSTTSSSLNKFLEDQSIEPVKVVKPQFDIGQSTDLTTTWLGHSTYVIRVPLNASQNSKSPQEYRTVLFDPIFSERASPIQLIGARRYNPVPCAIAELPNIDYVVISHNHYDHLDYNSINDLFTRFGEAIKFIVPLGNKTWFEDCGIPSRNIFQLDWWDNISFNIPLPQQQQQQDSSLIPRIEFHCVPAQHNSGRNGWDNIASTSLWSGWVVKAHLSPSGTKTIFFAGDTGYRSRPEGPTCPVFKEIGQRLGPMDLSLIPIWRGGGLSFLSWFGYIPPDDLLMATHCPPGDALQIHLDVKSNCSLPMHYATFAGSPEEALRPLIVLAKARLERNIGTWEQGGMSQVDIGQSIVIP